MSANFSNAEVRSRVVPPRDVFARLIRGFTLVELLVVIAIIAVLAALAVPAVTRAMDKSKRAACVSNLSVLGKAFHLYTADQGTFPQKATNSTPKPEPQDWLFDLKPYLGGKSSVTMCPVKHMLNGVAQEFRTNLDTNLVTNYGISYWILEGMRTAGGGAPGKSKRLPSLVNVPHASKVGVLIDANSNWLKDSQTNRVSYVHSAAANVLFMDGHVESLTSDKLLESGNLSCMGEPLP